MIVADERRVNVKIKKEQQKLIKTLGIIIKVDRNLKVIQYLDVELDLHTGNVSPYMKENIMLKYVNTSSNLPKTVIKHVPRGI